MYQVWMLRGTLTIPFPVYLHIKAHRIVMSPFQETSHLITRITAMIDFTSESPALPPPFLPGWP